MPITEAPRVDQRTEYVRALIEFAKDDDDANPYRIALEERQAEERAAAEAAAVEATAAAEKKRKRIADKKRGLIKRVPRPWQAAGFATKQAWLDAQQEVT